MVQGTLRGPLGLWRLPSWPHRLCIQFVKPVHYAGMKGNQTIASMYLELWRLSVLTAASLFSYRLCANNVHVGN